MSGLLFLVVVVPLIIAIFRFGERPDGREPEQVYGHRKLEITWTVIPALMLLTTFILAVITMNEVDTTAATSPHDAPIDVVAVGHQWWWEFDYPGDHFVTANEFHIPVNTTIAVHVTSDDVIHSFWVPQLDRQMDATPNNDHIVYIKATRTGVFPGQCYEYCGTDHAWMQFRAVVDTRAQYDAWIRRQQHPDPLPSGGLALEGLQLFSTYSCGSCHTLNGTPANGTFAPNLSHVGSRWGIAGGVLSMSQQNLARWIDNPDAYKPGVLMPAFNLSKHDLRALAAYLISQK